MQATTRTLAARRAGGMVRRSFATMKMAKRTSTPLSSTGSDESSSQRRTDIEINGPASYPRIDEGVSSKITRLQPFISSWGHLANQCIDETPVLSKGRISAIRQAASKLVFFDLIEDGTQLQVIQSLAKTGGTVEGFQTNLNMLRRGDHVELEGFPGRSRLGELSLYTTSLPKRLSPTLHIPPPALEDQGLRFQSRHVDLMVNHKGRNILRQRSAIINHVRNHFLSDDFVEVQTPILSDIAGGAVARPFETSSTVFGDGRKLQLRIAPELWLKRLVIGGMERVFELGVSFRNENADQTHNPEFTTCEFYQAYAGLEELMSRTEKLLRSISAMLRELSESDPRIQLLHHPSTDEPAVHLFEKPGPFACLDFMLDLQKELNTVLPDLDAPTALDDLRNIFFDRKIPLPASITVPALLDRLSSKFLEPKCHYPTYITNIPACLSPLSKSSIRPLDGQRISHRVELFVNGRELVNAYEEENSPFEQRRKFEAQLMYRLGEDKEGVLEAERVVDQSYISALEWGLPPTGGWGIGIDRLVMLMTGQESIREVMSFGGLRGASRGDGP